MSFRRLNGADTELVMPQVLAGFRLERHDIPVAVAGEDEPDAVVTTPETDTFG